MNFELALATVTFIGQAAGQGCVCTVAVGCKIIK